MDQAEKNKVIEKELQELIPKDISEDERGIWRMCFNALRLADFATSTPLGGEMVATLATIQTLFAGHCSSMSGPTLGGENKIIVLTCSNPNIDIEALLKAKSSLLPTWSFVVNSHSDPLGGVYDKIDFFKKEEAH